MWLVQFTRLSSMSVSWSVWKIVHTLFRERTMYSNRKLINYNLYSSIYLIRTTTIWSKCRINKQKISWIVWSITLFQWSFNYFYIIHIIVTISKDENFFNFCILREKERTEFLYNIIINRYATLILPFIRKKSQWHETSSSFKKALTSWAANLIWCQELIDISI